MTTTPELVRQGVALYARAECALRDAEEAVLSLREVYPAAYANGDLAGGDAVEMRNSCIFLAASIATVHDGVMAHHRRSIAHAKAAGADLDGPYAELPAVAAATTAAKPASGGR